MKNWEFNKSLQARGLNQGRLAELIQCRREHLCAVLNNRRGAHTRPKLFPLLTVDEIRSLGWLKDFQAWKANRGPWAEDWREHLNHLEGPAPVLRSTRNKVTTKTKP